MKKKREALAQMGHWIELCDRLNVPVPINARRAYQLTKQPKRAK